MDFVDNLKWQRWRGTCSFAEDIWKLIDRIVNFRLRHFSRRSRDSQSMEQNKLDSSLREATINGGTHLVMSREQSFRGSRPLVTFGPKDWASQIVRGKLEILEACRHHIPNLRCLLLEGSLCSASSNGLQFSPGPFVKIQLVVALRNDKQELFDCRLVAAGNQQCKVNGGRSVIKAEVKPAGSMYLAETLAIDCSGDELGSFTRNFVFLLPASIPTEYLISLEFRAVTGELLDDIQLQVLTHYQQTSLFDFCDGHSLLSVELPCPKKELVGILGTPEAQKIVSYFQELVENGAERCFRRDQLRLFQTIGELSHSEALLQDLQLAVKLEESLMLYQMGDYERCKQLGESICLHANTYHSPNYNSIAGTAKCTISSAYKMERNFTKAEELLDSSTELLESVVPGEETAINRTCLAALLSEKGTVEGITEQEKKKLKKALKDAMLHYRHQLNKTQRRNANSPRRALIRMILFYLHSTRDQATNLQIAVSNKVLDKVKEFIQQFNREFLVNCSMRDKALFCNAYGDLLTRKGQYEEAISSVSEALKIAEDLQLQTDIKGARDRLLQLDRLRMERGEGGQWPHDLDERRVARYQGFEEPGFEVLERFLEQLTRRVQR